MPLFLRSDIVSLEIASSPFSFSMLAMKWTSDSENVDLLVTLPLAIFALFALLLAQKYFFKYKFDPATLLFHELCKMHGLTNQEKRTLNRAAKQWRVDNPCLLFIDHHLWLFDDSVNKIAPSKIREKDPESFLLLSLRSRILRETT
jgi:hypothetical protein